LWYLFLTGNQNSRYEIDDYGGTGPNPVHDPLDPPPPPPPRGKSLSYLKTSSFNVNKSF